VCASILLTIELLIQRVETTRTSVERNLIRQTSFLSIRDNAVVLAGNVKFYILLTVQHLDAVLGNDHLDALFLNVFILCLYMFRAASAHHQEVQIVLIHHLV
jgi:hypothetical protein